MTKSTTLFVVLMACLMASASARREPEVQVLTTDFSGAGQCTDTQDNQTITSRFSHLQGDVQGCAFSCIVSGTSCMRRCVEKLGFTDNCAECWVKLASCSKSKCIWHCIDPKSSGCKKCAYDKCFPGLETCSGLSANQLPKP
mmetsp:Transcript_23541/g.28456  ORF Transcript_23541/g.28456 Transcript_23541/m.28456 type:complete len:142 (-) Transcript_23541:343-768(-)